MPSAGRRASGGARRRAHLRARRFLPFLSWLPGYRKDWVVPDVVAGATLWALVVPEALAYAERPGSGLAVLLGRDTAAFGVLLLIHLAAVILSFAFAPYSKFVHVVFRFAALIRDQAEQLPAPDVRLSKSSLPVRYLQAEQSI